MLSKREHNHNKSLSLDYMQEEKGVAAAAKAIS